MGGFLKILIIIQVFFLYGKSGIVLDNVKTYINQKYIV